MTRSEHTTEKPLTNLQQSVLAELRRKNFHLLAADTERFWKQGDTWYIDTRHQAYRDRCLQKNFELGNQDALRMV